MNMVKCSKMNFIKSLSHLSLFEFRAKWEYWQKKCIKVLSNENFSADSSGSMELICRVINFTY